jgi:hypothetical protein
MGDVLERIRLDSDFEELGEHRASIFIPANAIFSEDLRVRGTLVKGYTGNS